VFVFTAILPLCQDDDGIAAVLGHEIAHTVAHHASERMSRGSILAILSTIGYWTLGIPDVFSNLLLSLAFDLPNTRTQESEADFIGLMMMAQSCYNPDGAVSFWERMSKVAKGAPPEFLSTHPADKRRVENISKWLPEAEQRRDDSECGSTLGYGKHQMNQPSTMLARFHCAPASSSKSCWNLLALLALLAPGAGYNESRGDYCLSQLT
jgi:predicted Zn-dependent protease